MIVSCEVSEVDLEGDHGEVASVEVTCGNCGHTTSSYGTSDRSVRRCLALMREECPTGEDNYYEADE